MRHVPIIVDVFEHRFLSLQGMQKLKEEEEDGLKKFVKLRHNILQKLDR